MVFSTICLSLLRQVANISNIFLQSVGKLWGEDLKPHTTALHQLPSMSPCTNPSVHAKVSHMYLILPSFLLSLSSFVYVLCYFKRHKIKKLKYISWVGNERRKLIEDISFSYADVPFDNIWKRLEAYKTLQSQRHTHDSRYTVEDSGRYWQAILDGALRIKKCLRRNTFYFLVKR